MYDIIPFNTVCYETFEEILFLISEPHLILHESLYFCLVTLGGLVVIVLAM
jgi:hypothetical protein